VGEEYRALEEGKCVLFDDSFEHEACNTSLSEPRVVLIIDVWHPDLSDEEVRPDLRCLSSAPSVGDLISLPVHPSFCR
jgi:hypothetical protein